MPPTQLRRRDRAGRDVPIEISDGSLSAKAISPGQRMAGQLNPSVVDAGIMFDSTCIVEAQGTGVSANDLRVGNARRGYFRPPRLSAAVCR